MEENVSIRRDPAPGWHARADEDRRHHPSREPAAASEEHIAIGEALRLHVFRDAEFPGPEPEWVVWLNTEVSDFDGLVLSSGKDRQQAVERAVAVAEMIADALQAPPPRILDKK
jgi:hypothetical protein